MSETTSTFANNRRLVLLTGRLAAVIGVVLAFHAILAFPVEADVNIADIVCWQCAPPPEAVAVAVNVRLTILPQLVKGDSGLAKRLGFDGASEINSNPTPTDVQYPFVVYHVGVDRLQRYQPLLHDPATLLLDDTNWTYAPFPHPLRFLFPLKGGTHIRSSVLVSLPLLKNLPVSATRWELQWIGSPNLTTRLIKCGGGGVIGGPNTCDGKTYFVVWIPALNRYYLGRFVQGKLKLTILFKDRLGFQEGQELLAGAVFMKLKPEAFEIVTQPKSPPR